MPGQTTRSQLRNKIRLQLVLKRGTDLARVYQLPEVGRRILQRYTELAERDQGYTHVVEDYLLMSGDSYRVLGAAASYAASEFRTVDEYIDETSLKLSAAIEHTGQDFVDLLPLLRECYRELAGFVARQQKILDNVVALAGDFSADIAMSIDDLYQSAIRGEFAVEEDYRCHVCEQFSARISATDRLVQNLVSSSDALQETAGEIRRATYIAEIAAREAVQYELPARLATIYGATAQSP